MRRITFSIAVFALMVAPVFGQSANRSTPVTTPVQASVRVVEPGDVRACRQHCDGLRANGARVMSSAERHAQQTTCAKKMVSGN